VPSASTKEGKMLYMAGRLLKEGVLGQQLTPTQVCAIVGNAGHESGGYRPDAYNPNDRGAPGGGLFGFRGATGEYFEEMKQFCARQGKDWKSSIEAQLTFFMTVRKSNHTRWLNWIKKHPNEGLYDATVAFCRKWEVGDWARDRYNYAKKVAELLKKYEGCEVTIDEEPGSTESTWPCDQLSSTELDEMYTSLDAALNGEYSGREIAIVGDSWSAGLINAIPEMKGIYNCQYCVGSKKVKWCADQVKNVVDQGAKIGIFICGLNSAYSKFSDSSTGRDRMSTGLYNEYGYLVDECDRCGLTGAVITSFPYTKHSDIKKKSSSMFSDAMADNHNKTLQHIIDLKNRTAINCKFEYCNITTGLKDARDHMSEGGFHLERTEDFKKLRDLIGTSLYRLNNKLQKREEEVERVHAGSLDYGRENKQTATWQDYFNNLLSMNGKK